eukprot:TRINITY_DN4432_c0_g1_i2.p1 TRINITY_DN4432_c0_g1~~TRINITY_DN4432_c0_g1_i2.p1  ORF type:complete len:1042 (+),score=228.32 TRINITY_DN4432_c0_g1_i2:83-3208(+)
MLRHTSITLERVEKFVSDTYFTDVNIYGKIYPKILRHPLQLKVFHAPGRISYDEAMKGEYVETKVGESFGPSWSTHWFKVTGSIPPQFKGKEVHLLWNSGSEGLIWKDGEPLQGLTGGTWVDKRIHYRLTHSAKGDEKVDLEIEMACNGMFGVGKDGLINAPDPTRTFTLSQAEVAVYDPLAYSLYLDLIMLHEIAKKLHEKNVRGAQALYVANQMINIINVEDESRETWLKAKQLSKEFFSVPNGGAQHSVTAIGHCHIDLGWLWPYAETRRKAGRSWATQILYMEDYPNYKFTQSQAQLFEWCKKDYPQLYKRVIEKVKSGQFVPTGGTWVEMDGNLPSGESFVRQFVYGQKLYKQEFGIQATEFWLPDTFGYSGQLPQVVTHCGIKNFITQKLSWNNINKFPYNTFLWEGIDGSQVLTHFPPANTYNSNVSIKEVVNSSKNNKDKDRSNHSLLVFGHGDGGGGPNVEMLERLERVKDVDGIPKVEQESTAHFFSKVTPDKEKLLTWIGELYFELHRGTYTSQAKTKLGNRVSEILLHDSEFVATLAHLVNKKYNYPQDKLDVAWKYVLLNQFHDVLPGSSIGMVYKDALEYYGIVSKICHEIIDEAKDSIFHGNEKKDFAVINATSFDRTEVITLPDEFKKAKNTQVTFDGKSLGVVSSPSLGFSSIHTEKTSEEFFHKSSVSAHESNGVITLENSFVRVVIQSDGEISSVFHKPTKREAIEPGKTGNKFVLFDDIPLFWDGWDTEVYSLQKTYPLGKGKATLLESGPLRAVVQVQYPHLTQLSSISQVITLTATSPRVDFITDVDWHESRKFLKVEFPTSVRSPTATYEIQFGHVTRPTHFNTTWDMARFEVCGHRWGDLSEYNFGFALLNDSKYGYQCHRNVLRLSLLRAPKSPDDECDMGSQHFVYSILPHKGTLQESDVIKEGYALNYPLRVTGLPQHAAENLSTTFKVISEEGSKSVIIETIKIAEDKDGVVLRVYESLGGLAKFKLSSSLPFKGLVKCSGLEAQEKHLQWDRGVSEEITLTPFQVNTFKLLL